MKIDFDNIPLQELANFKGGDLHYDARIFDDGKCKIMRGSLVPGASIGMHTHNGNCEVIYITKGTATAVSPEGEETFCAGECHYCPEGCAHSLRNNTQQPLEFLAIVR